MTAQGPLSPGAMIGIVGTGQLGRMLAAAAQKLGFKVIVFGPETSPPAAEIAADHICAAYEDVDALKRFADLVEVATYEFENIPPMTVRTLIELGVPVRPDDRVLSVCQDRISEKTFLRENGLQTAPFFQVDKVSDLADALASHQGQAVLKTRRFGYDGKGQVRIRPGDDPAVAIDAIAGAPAILEGFVEFDFEVSQVAARGLDGTVTYFDISENQHKDGILSISTVPSSLPQAGITQVRTLTRRLMDALDYVGVMAVEFFWHPTKGVIANEIAPRVHNTGHWTVEACRTSQFEQHIRAIAGWPLGDATRHSDATMRNLLGTDVNAWDDIVKTPAAALTLYGKKDPRPGRKMGHVVETTPIAPADADATPQDGQPKPGFFQRLLGSKA